MTRLETLVGGAFILLCVVAVAVTRDLAYWPAGAPGPRFAPVWIAGLGIALALLMIREGRRRAVPRAVNWPDRPGAVRLLMIAAALWAVIALSPVLGFVAAATAFCLAYCLVIMRCPVLPGLLTTLAVLVLLQGVFVMALDVRLPTGVLGF